MDFAKKFFLAIAAACVVGSFFVINDNPFAGTAMRWFAFLFILAAFLMRE
jgi:hypothetical protein